MTAPKPASALPWRFTVDAADFGDPFVELMDAKGCDIFDPIDSDKRMFGKPADAAYIVHAANSLPKVEAERDRLRAALILAHEQFQYMVHIMNERGAPFYIGADSECQSRIEALAAALKETP